MIALLPLFAVVQPADAAAFAPPLDVPIHCTVREVRDNGRGAQRLTMGRRVIFRRSADGYVAEVTTQSADGAPDNAFASLFLAGASASVGRTLRFRLDRAGRIVEVIDRDAEWRGWVERVTGAMSRHGADAAAVVERMAAPLRAAPPARQVETLSGQLTVLIGSDIVMRGETATTAIRLPAQSAVAPASLDGTERITRRTDGMLRYERAAEGPIGTGGTVRSTSQRVVDPATGLVHETRDATAITLAGKTLTSEKTVVLRLPPVS